MRVVLLFFLALCVASTLGQRTAVDLWFNQGAAGYNPGYVSLPVLKLGMTGALGLEVNCFLQTLVNNERNSLIYLAQRNSAPGASVRSVADDIEVFLVNTGTTSTRVGVRLGAQDFLSSATVNVKATWAYIAVNVYNNAAGKGVVELYVNGVKQTLPNGGVASTFVLNPIDRDYNYMGFSPITARFRGLVDTLQIWDQAVSVAQIQTNAAFTNGDFPWTPTGLIARFDFEETTGYWTYARPGTASRNRYAAFVDQPRATFSSGSYVGWTYCYGWGDPHYTTYLWGDFSASTDFTPPHVIGYYSIAACSNSAGTRDLQISAWHAPSGGTATYTRAMSFRHGNSMFQYAVPYAQQQQIDGTYVWKEIPEGADPLSVQWNQMQLGDSKVLASGMSVTIQSNGDISVFAAPYMTASLKNQGWWYMDFTIYINRGACNMADTNEAMCRLGRQPVDSWVFTGIPVNPPPLAPSTPIAPPPPSPTCTGTLQDVAQTNCKRCFPAWATTQAFQYDACVGDVCETANPWCPPAPCVPGEPCCRCASTGSCVIAADNSTSCSCDAGYGGADCSQSLNLVSLSLTTSNAAQMYDGRPYTLVAYSIDDGVERSTNPSPATLVKANPWVVTNSLLVYVATMTYPTESGMTPTQHLYVVNDATSFPGNWQHELTIGYPEGFGTYGGSAATTATTFTNDVVLNNGGNKPTTATFNTRSTSSTGFVIPNLPAGKWCVDLQTNFADSVGQVVVGSGNIRGQLELLRVLQSSTGAFTVCGENVQDPCPNLKSCSVCVANAACGWCRTTSQCHFGRPAGPTDGSLCPAWAFTFEAVTRRITQSYGYPVTPISTTVVLNAADANNLPIEIKVDMAYRFYTPYDVQLLFPNSASNGADLAGLKASIRAIADNMAANYLNSALSVATYSSRAVAATPDANGDAVVFSQVFPLASTTSSAGMATYVSQLSTTARTGSPQLTSVAMGKYAGLANNRLNARTLIISFATEADSVPAATAAATLKPIFTRVSALPVFAVSPAAKAYYQQVVQQIGFGLVVDYASPATIAQSVSRALTDASGATFMTVDTLNAGRINTGALNPFTASLTVTGMSALMASRNNFPVAAGQGNNDHAAVLAPGFGVSTIDAVASDSPFTNGPAVRMTVGVPLTPTTSDTTTAAALAHLTGAPAVVLQSNALVTSSVKSTLKGQLYQFDEAALRAGALISSLTPITLDGSTYVTVTDVLGRVIYVPPVNQFGDADDVAYDYITYKVNDECSDSPDGQVPVYVKYANNEPPTTTAAAVNTKENQAVVITLSAVDYRAHTLKFTTLSVVNAAGNNDALSGTLYQYSAECAAALAADHTATAGCSVITASTEITGTATAGSDSTTVSTIRVIYVPYTYANSEGIPKVYLTTPVVAYKAVQLANQFDGGSFRPLETVITTFGVNVSAVNQAPFAYKPAEASTWLSFDASTYLELTDAACQSVNDAATTSVTCTFDQNMGVPYPGLPSPIGIYTVGFDVDNDVLAVAVKSVSCPADAIINGVSTNTRVGAGLLANQQHTADSWATDFTFRPSLDGSGSPYCTVSYVYTDGQSESEVRTITIVITPVPMPPRSADQRFFAPTLDSLPIEFTAAAVSERSAQGTVQHFIRRAEIIACVAGDFASDLTVEPNTAALDCSAVSASSPYVINVASNADDTVESLYGTGTVHTFAGNWTPTALSTSGFSVSIRYFDDSDLQSDVYTLSFSYRQVNQAPELQWLAADNAQFLVNQTQSIGFQVSGGSGGQSMSFNVRDVDAGENAFFNLSVAYSGAPAGAKVGFGSADEGVLQPLPQGNGVTTVSSYGAIQNILSTLNVYVSNAPNSVFSFTVTVTVNDNSFTGACSEDIVTPCDKIGTAIVKVTTSVNSRALAIGLSAGAGAAAAGAAAAAAIAWRALREPPTESYNPWEMDDNNEGTVMNPLFEGTGNSGGNPMFEGAAKP